MNIEELFAETGLPESQRLERHMTHPDCPGPRITFGGVDTVRMLPVPCPYCPGGLVELGFGIGLTYEQMLELHIEGCHQPQHVWEEYARIFMEHRKIPPNEQYWKRRRDDG